MAGPPSGHAWPSAVPAPPRLNLPWGQAAPAGSPSSSAPSPSSSAPLRSCRRGGCSAHPPGTETHRAALCPGAQVSPNRLTRVHACTCTHQLSGFPSSRPRLSLLLCQLFEKPQSSVVPSSQSLVSPHPHGGESLLTSSWCSDRGNALGISVLSPSPTCPQDRGGVSDTQGFTKSSARAHSQGTTLAHGA